MIFFLDCLNQNFAFNYLKNLIITRKHTLSQFFDIPHKKTHYFILQINKSFKL